MEYWEFEQLCNQHGIKPYQVSKETGVSTATLSSWKAGKYTPKADKIARIESYFNAFIKPKYENDPGAELVYEVLNDPETYYITEIMKKMSPEAKQRLTAYARLLVKEIEEE